MAFKFTTVPQTYLASDLTSSGTKIKLRGIDSWKPDTDLVAGDFGTTMYAVIFNKDKTRMEIIELDPSTIANYATPGIDITTRGLPFTTDGDSGDTTEVTALKRDWAQGDIVLLGSNPPQLFSMVNRLWNGGTLPGDYTFSGTATFPAGADINAPKSGSVYSAPTNDLEYASKKFVADIASGVGISYDKIVTTAIGGETITAGQIVYLKPSDQEWYLADASVTGTADNIMYGIAQGAGTNGVSITGGVLLQGLDENQAGLTAGKQFLSDTAGGLSNVTGTVEITMGIAEDATSIIFMPLYDQNVTEDQLDAFVGTSGTPSSTNKFVTNDDVTEAKTASKIPRRDLNGDILVATTPTAGDAASSKTYTDAQILASNSKIVINTTQTTLTNSVTETDILSTTIAANTLSTNNGIRFKIFVSDYDIFHGQTLTLKVKYGVTTVISQVINAHASVDMIDMKGYIEGHLLANVATNAQKGFINFEFTQAWACVAATDIPYGIKNAANGSSAEDSTGDLTLAVTATWSNATADNNIVVEGYTVESII